ncbi:MAG TPA: hypothetical protein EYG73_09340 [Arcobacter sp.]|nr:hypothetical protein [Arcobacter sp.]
MIKTILQSSFFLLVGNVFGRSIMFITNVFIARLLSQEKFGEYMLIRNTIITLHSIVNSSSNLIIIKEVAIARKNPKHISVLVTILAVINFLIALTLSCLLFYLTPYMVEYFFLGKTSLINILYISSLMLFFSLLASFVQNLLIGFEEYQKIALSSIYASFLSLPIVFIFIYFYAQTGAIIGVTLYFTIDFIIKYIILNKIQYNVITMIDILKESKKILLFSLPLLISIFISSLSFWYARTLIIEETNSFADIAIFDAAFQWLTIIMLITGSTSSVVLPMLVKADKKNKIKIFKINLIINFLLSVIIALFFIIFSTQIMSIYGDNYIKGGNILTILAGTAIFFTISSIFNKWMISHEEVWIIPIINLVSSISLFIVLHYSFQSPIIKLALSFCSFYLISSCMYIFYFYKRSKIL